MGNKSVIQNLAENHGAVLKRNNLHDFYWEDKHGHSSHGSFSTIDDTARDYLDWLINGMKYEIKIQAQPKK